MSTLLGTELPIVGAPMAGGPTTPALVDAVVGAGGFGFLAAGYRTADALAADLATTRDRDRLGVNLFVPSPDAVDPVAYRAYAARLADDAALSGVELPPEPVVDDDDWRAKIDLLTSDPVPVVSLTFGLPDSADIAALRRAGSRVLASVTTPDEARTAEDAGVDALLVQGPRAGGHSATFDPSRTIGSEATADVLRAVRTVSALPVVAAGGVDGPATTKELLAAGADAVAIGTLLLLADEAGTTTVHRRALTDAAYAATTITHAFTGRPARGLRNAFIDRHEAEAPLGYPALHHLTRGIRQAAVRRDDPDRLHLWAGTGWRSAEARPAADIVRALAAGL